MKSLEQIGKKLIVHGKEVDKKRIAECPCGLSHIFTDVATTRFVDCNCGRRVKLWNRKELML